MPAERHLSGEDFHKVLFEFADELANVLAFCEATFRASLALDRLAETVLVLDHQLKLQFVNQQGRKLWPGIDTSPVEDWDADLREGIHNAAHTRQRFVNSPTRLAGGAHEGIIVYEPLLAVKHLIGVLVHVQPKSYYADILNGFKVLASSSSETHALEGLLTVFRGLGVEWVRLYRIEGDRLRPDTCVDPERPAIKTNFLQVRLPDRDDSPTWHVIQKKEPHAFSFDQSKKDAEVFVTHQGLRVIAQPNPHAPDLLGKKPGDFWIDFPLMRGDDVIGKFTIPCPHDMTPERFQMFNVLSGLVSETLQRLSQRQPPLTAEMLSQKRGQLTDALAPLDVLSALVHRAFAHDIVGENEQRVLGIAFRVVVGRHVIGRIVGQEPEPFLQPPLVQKRGFAKEQIFHVGARDRTHHCASIS